MQHSGPRARGARIEMAARAHDERLSRAGSDATHGRVAIPDDLIFYEVPARKGPSRQLRRIG